MGLGSQGGAGPLGAGMDTLVKGSASSPGAGGSGPVWGSGSGSRGPESNSRSPQSPSGATPSRALVPAQLAAVDASDTPLFLRRNTDRRRPSWLPAAMPGPTGRRRCQKSPCASPSGRSAPSGRSNCMSSLASLWDGQGVSPATSPLSLVDRWDRDPLLFLAALTHLSRSSQKTVAAQPRARPCPLALLKLRPQSPSCGIVSPLTTHPVLIHLSP